MMKHKTLASLAGLSIVLAPVFAMAAEEGEAGAPPAINEGLMTAVVTLVVFVALVIILGKVAWKPIAKGLSAREAKIRTDIEQAEAARRGADAAKAEYAAQLAKAGDEVRAMLDKATADAQAAATRIRMQAQQEAEEAKERALKDIEASRRAAVAEIHEYAATLSTSIAEKILRRNLNVDDQRALVSQSLEKLGSLN